MDRGILTIFAMAIIGFALVFIFAQGGNENLGLPGGNGGGRGSGGTGGNGGIGGSGGSGSTGSGGGDGAGGNVGAGGIQDVYVKAGWGGYDKPEVRVKAGSPVRFHFSADQNSGCGRALFINEFGVSLISRSGEEQVATFTPKNPGTYQYHCSMYMFVGNLVVT
ncbi:hypothetical protein FJZ26_02135 [Candidatus Parvarchaeota archaeon]|nr:hypothetical protein [Candidatus Parvarchaeota archaeon]